MFAFWKKKFGIIYCVSENKFKKYGCRHGTVQEVIVKGRLHVNFFFGLTKSFFFSLKNFNSNSTPISKIDMNFLLFLQGILDPAKEKL